MRAMLAVAFVTWATIAQADVIDVYGSWANEAAAQTALATLGRYYNAQIGPSGQAIGYALDTLVPNIKVWRSSQDNISCCDANGQNIITHTYQTGWYCIVSFTTPRDNAVLAILQGAAAAVIAINRTKMEAGQSGFVLKNTFSNAILQDLRWSPVTTNSMPLPWGTLN